jgi:hypothetical protein
MRGCREDRVPTNTRGPSREIIAQRARRPQVEAENTPAFPARMVYGLYVISSVSQCSFATVASREPEPARNLTPASGRQDHTISPSAIAPLVSQRIRVHRIPHSTFVTFAIAPLQSRRDGGTIALICDSGKQNYFCSRGLTGICERRLSGKSALRALTAVLVTGSRQRLPSMTPGTVAAMLSPERIRDCNAFWCWARRMRLPMICSAAG